jgi:hypothetical protein
MHIAKRIYRVPALKRMVQVLAFQCLPQRSLHQPVFLGTMSLSNKPHQLVLASSGVTRSRKIARALENDVAFRYLAANEQVDV